MNIINKTFLQLALLPAPFYKRIGVHIPQLKSILTTKLTIDDRRPNTFHQTRQKKQEKPISMATIGTMFLSALLGAMYLVAFAIGNDIITHLTIYFSLFFFMLASTLISDFTSVLIDIRDNFIILPKPVNDRTVVIAKLLHIFIHMGKIILPMSLPGLILICIQYNIIGGLIFLLIVFLVTLFTIFFINALYIFILRITTPQRFQAIISYIQILFAIIIYASYQLVPRLMGRFHTESLDLAAKKYMLFYPFYWFAAGWKIVYTLNGSYNEVISALLCFVVPVLSIVLVVKYLAPSFSNKLAMINTSETSGPVKKKKTAKNSYADLLSKLFTRSAAERMGFLFTWKMTGRSRDFKLKVYPSIGYLLVYGVIIFLGNNGFRLEDIQEDTTRGRIIILSVIYFTSLLLVMALNQMIYSDKYKASWIYYVCPLKKPGEVISGAMKAAILKFYIPIVFLLTIAAIFLIGPQVLPNIILGLSNQWLIATVIVYIGNKMFPFSVLQNTNSKTGSFLRNLSVMFFSGILALIHFAIFNILSVVIIGCMLSVIAAWMMMGSIKNISWDAVKSTYAEE